jgi:hypothetical protein
VVSGGVQAVGDAAHLELVLAGDLAPDDLGDLLAVPPVVAAHCANAVEHAVVSRLRDEEAVLEADPVRAAAEVQDDPALAGGETRPVQECAHMR